MGRPAGVASQHQGKGPARRCTWWETRASKDQVKLEVVPEREAFANKEYKRFDKWYGEGSPDGEDAVEKKLGK